PKALEPRRPEGFERAFFACQHDAASHVTTRNHCGICKRCAKCHWHATVIRTVARAVKRRVSCSVRRFAFVPQRIKPLCFSWFGSVSCTAKSAERAGFCGRRAMHAWCTCYHVAGNKPRQGGGQDCGQTLARGSGATSENSAFQSIRARAKGL